MIVSLIIRSLLSIAVKPDTATLCNELGSVSDWHTLGLNLGVKDHELDQIEKSHPTEGCSRWKQETFSLWLRRKSNASWQDVAGALRQMEENTVAERIELKYNDTSKLCSVLYVDTHHQNVHPLWCNLQFTVIFCLH